MTGREKWLDSLKGFLICLVVIGHIAIDYYNNKFYGGGHSEHLTLTYNLIYEFHMPLFICISGFFFYGTYQKGKTKRSVINDLLLYFEWQMIYWSFKTLFLNDNSPEFYIKNIVMEIVCKPLNGVYWYLYVLLICKIVACLLLRIKKSFYLFISMGALALQCIYVYSEMHTNIPTEYVFIRLLGYFTFFWLGIMMNEYGLPKSKCENCKICFGIFIYIVLNIVHMDFSNMTGWASLGILGLILSYASITVLVNVFKFKIKKSVILEFLGENTLPIYVLHYFFLVIMRKILVVLGINYFLVCFMFSFLISIMGPILIFEITRKIGVNKILFNPYK